VEGVAGCGVDEQGAVDRTERVKALLVALSSWDGLMRVKIIDRRREGERSEPVEVLWVIVVCCSRRTAIFAQLAGDAA
jgi:hypothetical protein